MLQSIWLTLVLVSTSAQNLTKVVPGVYTEEVRDVLLFEAEFEWNLQVNLPVTYELLKPDTSCSGAAYLCSLERALYDGYRRLREQTISGQLFHHKQQGNVSRRGLLNFVGEGYKFLFGLQTEADSLSFQKNLESLAEQEAKLQSNVLEDHAELVEIVRNLSSYSHHLQDFLAERNKQVDAELAKAYNSNQRNEAVLGNSIQILMSITYTLNALSEMNLVSLECRNGLVPISIIGANKFSQEYEDLRKKLVKHGLELPASPAALLSKKIGRCVVTRDSVYVNMKIPVRSTNSELKLFRLVPVPFVNRDEQCVVAGVTAYVVVSKRGVTPIVPALTHTCDISNSKMCKVPSGGHDTSRFASCASTLLAEHTADELIKNCPLQCHQSNAKVKTWVADNQLVLTNYNSIRLECLTPKFDKNAITDAHGAVFVTVRCGCVVTADEEVIEGPTPCFNSSRFVELGVNTIIPAGWSSLRSLVLTDSSQFRNLSDIMNKDWKKNVPFLQLTEPKSLLETKEFHTSLPVVGPISITEDMLIIWLTVITLVLGYMSVNSMLLSCRQNQFSLNPTKYIPFFPAGAHAATDESKELLGKVWSIIIDLEWTTVAGYVLLFMLCCLVLVVCCRILRYVKKTASCLASVTQMSEFDEEESLNDHDRRRRRGKK